MTIFDENTREHLLYALGKAFETEDGWEVNDLEKVIDVFEKSKDLRQYVIKARKEGYRNGRDYIIELHKDHEVKARIEELCGRRVDSLVRKDSKMAEYLKERIAELKEELGSPDIR